MWSSPVERRPGPRIPTMNALRRGEDPLASWEWRRVIPTRSMTERPGGSSQNRNERNHEKKGRQRGARRTRGRGREAVGLQRS
jgi:hypothetical protein